MFGEEIMDVCPNFNLIAWSHTGKIDPTTGKKIVKVVNLRCKKWSCDFCLKKNSAAWEVHLRKYVLDHPGEWYLLTLTANEHDRTMAASYKALQHGIDVLLKRARRLFGELDYARTFEKHPTSEALHAHFIIRGLSPYVVNGCTAKLRPAQLAVIERKGHVGTWALQTWFKRTALDCGLGYMADVRPIKTMKAVWYVIKYLHKSASEITIKGIRRVQTSQSIGSPKPEQQERWQAGKMMTAYFFAHDEVMYHAQRRVWADPALWEDGDVWEYEGFRAWDEPPR